MEKHIHYQTIEHDEGQVGGVSDRKSSDEQHSKTHLLQYDNGSSFLHGHYYYQRRSWAWLISRIGIVAVVLVLYSFLIVGVTLKVSRESRKHGTRFLSSLAGDYITYKPRVFQQWENVDPDAPVYFTGEPRQEIDQNWHNLLGHMNTRVPASVMEELGRTEQGIRFPDGTYFGSLMVFHHLHCLKNIYHALHPQYYRLDRFSESEEAEYQDHIEHCFHMLKEAVTCQADPTLLTMKWAADNSSARAIGNLTSPHECVDWDRLMEWVVPNSVDVFADGVLVHPVLGPVYRNGEFVAMD
ncbi:hypothetical protein F5Y17DRAFT_411689 [Xylariaceae sp. FL0594]|nr:hypothetical protein F5Y17DRAFT_411689 [Xylariaceae sp. FL0594]